MASPSARTPKGAATRADILKVAGDVFAAKGYAQTRMDDIISASGLTKGAIYFHFDSKARLAEAVIVDHQERWLSRVREEIIALPEPRDQLMALTPFLTHLVASDPTAWSAGRLSAELRTELGDVAPDPLAEWVDLVADILLRGRNADQLDFESDPRELAAVLVGAFDGIKSLTDALDGADATAFALRTSILQRLVEAHVRTD